MAVLWKICFTNIIDQFEIFFPSTIATVSPRSYDRTQWKAVKEGFCLVLVVLFHNAVRNWLLRNHNERWCERTIRKQGWHEIYTIHIFERRNTDLRLSDSTVLNDTLETDATICISILDHPSFVQIGDAGRIQIFLGNEFLQDGKMGCEDIAVDRAKNDSFFFGRTSKTYGIILSL